MQDAEKQGKRAWLRFPFRIIGLVLLAWILFSIDTRETLAQISNTRLSTAALAAIPFTGLLVLRCWRWADLARAAGSQLPQSTLMSTCNESIWLGLVSPARLGEFQRAFPLARNGTIGLAEATILVFFDVCLDLYGMVLAAASGLAAQWIKLTWGLAGSATVLFVGAMLAGLGAVALVWLPLSLVPDPKEGGCGRCAAAAGLAARLGRNLRGTASLRICFQTAGVFVCFVAMLIVLLSELPLALDTVQAATMVGLVGVSGAIPVTYFGLGTREAVLIWYLGSLGYGSETAVAVSVAFLLAYFVGIAVSLTFGVILRLSLGKPAD